MLTQLRYNVWWIEAGTREHIDRTKEFSTAHWTDQQQSVFTFVFSMTSIAFLSFVITRSKAVLIKAGTILMISVARTNSFSLNYRKRKGFFRSSLKVMHRWVFIMSRFTLRFSSKNILNRYISFDAQRQSSSDVSVSNRRISFYARRLCVFLNPLGFDETMIFLYYDESYQQFSILSSFLDD